MQPNLPSAVEIASLLNALSYTQMVELAQSSSVPLSTLFNIRNGTTRNPRLETIRMFLPFVAEPAKV